MGMRVNATLTTRCPLRGAVREEEEAATRRTQAATRRTQAATRRTQAATRRTQAATRRVHAGCHLASLQVPDEALAPMGRAAAQALAAGRKALAQRRPRAAGDAATQQKTLSRLGLPRYLTLTLTLTPAPTLTLTPAPTLTLTLTLT